MFLHYEKSPNPCTLLCLSLYFPLSVALSIVSKTLTYTRPHNIKSTYLFVPSSTFLSKSFTTLPSQGHAFIFTVIYFKHLVFTTRITPSVLVIVLLPHATIITILITRPNSSSLLLHSDLPNCSLHIPFCFFSPSSLRSYGNFKECS